MPRCAASGSAASRANSAAVDVAGRRSVGRGGCTVRAASAMIRGYDLRVPPPPRAMTPRSFLLTPELADYVRAASEPPDDVAADLLAETAAMAERGEAPADLPDRPRAGRVHAAAHPRARGAAGDRDRHVHRLLGALHRPRPARGRLAALPGPQRGVDGGGPAVLGPRRGGRPDRAAARRRAAHAARAAAGRDLRPGVRRRGQDRLPGLRRGAVPADDAERRRAAGQHPARRAGARPADATTTARSSR